MLMSATMTLPYSLFLLICIINIISSYPGDIVSAKTTPVKHQRLATKLIHYDSIRSPYYNPNAIISERAERAIKSSLARVLSLSKIIYTPNNDDIVAGLVAAGNFHGFFANISIGTPPVPQLLQIDTGSHLLWCQCMPCTSCYKQYPPLFDSTKSSSYSNIPCDSPTCFLLGGKCDANDTYCTYTVTYLDSTSSAGNLASEQATFETSDEGRINVPIEVFGCGHANNNSVAEQSGILGLSMGYGDTPTLVKQLGSKFSYCTGDMLDAQYQYNQLILGEGAIMQGNPTTLKTDKYFYYVELQGISFGEKTLKIDPGVFQRGPSGEGGVIIDSGTILTFLKEEGYVPLRNEVESFMTGKLSKVNHPLLLCYSGRVGRDLTEFPVITLQFSGGAQLSLDIKSTFFQLTADVLCMTIVQILPEMEGVSMIGMMAQQFHNVGYDIGQGKIFFQRIDCDAFQSLV